MVSGQPPLSEYQQTQGTDWKQRRSYNPLKTNRTAVERVNHLSYLGKLQSYWSGIVDELYVASDVPVELDPLCLLHGLTDAHSTNIKHKRLLNLLTFGREEK